MNIRLYVTSVYRTISSQIGFFLNLKALFSEHLKSFDRKNIKNNLITNREKLEKKREFINSEASLAKSKNMNFIR